MSFVLFGVGALALLFVTVVVIGMLMPQRYEGETQVLLASSAEEVWGALLDHDKHPMTGKMKKSVQARQDENGLPVWTEDMGRGELITVRTVEAERPERMVREMTAKAVPMTSRWEYFLEASGDRCKLTIRGETTIRSGSWLVPIFRVMMVLGGGVKKGFDIQIDMVADSLGIKPERGS